MLSVDGGAVWFPSAFDEYGQRVIRDRCAGLIETTPEEAAQFACNAVVLGNDIVLPAGCPKLCQALAEKRYSGRGLQMPDAFGARQINFSNWKRQTR